MYMASPIPPDVQSRCLTARRRPAFVLGRCTLSAMPIASFGNCSSFPSVGSFRMLPAGADANFFLRKPSLSLVNPTRFYTCFPPCVLCAKVSALKIVLFELIVLCICFELREGFLLNTICQSELPPTRVFRRMLMFKSFCP